MTAPRTLRHAALRALDVFGLTAAVVAAALGFLVLALLRGPLPIDFVKTPIEQALNARLPGLSIQIGSVELRLDRVLGPITLAVTDVTIAGPSIQAPVNIQRLDLSVSVTAMLHGDIAIDEIIVDRASIQIARGDSGPLSLAPASQSPGGADPVSTLAVLLSQVQPHKDANPSFVLTNADLHLPVLVSNGPASIRIGRLAATSHGDRIRVSVEARLPGRQGDGLLRVQGDIPAGGGSFPVKASIHGLDTGFVRHWATLPTVGVPPLVSGAFDGVYDLSTGHAKGSFSLSAPAFLSPVNALATRTTTVGDIEAKGRIDTAIPMVVIDSLFGGVEGSRFAAAALLADVGEGLRLKLNVNAESVNAGLLGALIGDKSWPQDLDGTIQSLALQMGGKMAPSGFEVDAEGLQLDARVAGMKASIGDTVLSGISGSLGVRQGKVEIRLSDGRFARRGAKLAVDNIHGTGTADLPMPGKPGSLQLALASAMIGPIRVTNGSMGLKPEGSGTRLDLVLPVAGPLQHLLTAIASQDDAAEALTSAVKINAGTASGRIAIAAPSSGPSRTSLSLDIQGLAATTEGGARVTGDQITLAYGEDGFKASGNVAYDGLPAQLEVHRRKSGEIVAKMRGEIRLDQLGANYKALRGIARGTLRPDIEAVFRPADGWIAQGAVDLADAAIDLPAIRWSKRQKQPGSAKFSASRSPDGAIALTRLKLTAGDLDLQGDLTFGAGGSITHAKIDRLRYGGGDGTSVALDYRTHDGGWAKLSVSGDRIDLRPFIEEPSLIDRPTEIDVRAAAATATDELRITGLGIRGTHNGKGWDRLNGEAALGNAGTVRFQAQGLDGRTRLTAYSNNAASLVASFAPGFASGMLSGGEIAVTLDMDGLQAAGPTMGTVQIKDMTINRPMVFPPGMSQVTGLANFNDITKAKTTRLAAAEGSFTKSGPLIRFQDLFAYNNVIALTAAGTLDLRATNVDVAGELAPYEIVQRLVSQAPNTGSFVRGKDRAGIVAVPFQITGPFDNVDISIDSGLRAAESTRLREIVRLIGKPMDFSVERRMNANAR